MKPKLTIADIAGRLASAVNKELGVKIEVTIRDWDHWTISGPTSHVNRAMDWLIRSVPFTEEMERQTFEDETFAYVAVITGRRFNPSS